MILSNSKKLVTALAGSTILALSTTATADTQNFASEGQAQAMRKNMVMQWDYEHRSCKGATSCEREAFQRRQPIQQLQAAVAQCDNWLPQFEPSEKGLSRWTDEVGVRCALLPQFLKVDEKGGNLQRQGNVVFADFTKFKQNLAAHFEDPLVDRWLAQRPPGKRSKVPSKHLEEIFAHATGTYLSISEWSSADMRRVFAQADADHARANRRQQARVAAAPTPSPKRTPSGPMRGSDWRAQENQRMKDRTANEIGTALGIIGAFTAWAAKESRYDPSEEYHVPGKAVFNGIVFGGDEFTLDEVLSVYPGIIADQWAESNSRVTTTGRTDAKGLTVQCWDYRPKARFADDMVSKRTCLYGEKGRVVGGIFPSNQYDKNLIGYIGRQGFRLQWSKGMEELGYPKMMSRYAMGDMRLGYERFNSRANSQVAKYDSNFCFFPARLEKALNDAQKCMFIPR